MSLPDHYDVETADSREQRRRDAAETLVAEAPELVEFTLLDGPGGMPLTPAPPHVLEAVAALLASCDGDLECAKTALREARGT